MTFPCTEESSFAKRAWTWFVSWYSSIRTYLYSDEMLFLASSFSRSSFSSTDNKSS
eukprot:CAMPEP_0177414652 /NCGR_PEP_ID=MMETSP0368-20130122/67170_1 /TAXON_ID=447022 ORGANISM="Scrippsiella hangoei-like, Strain SHHI-4" /NCGR_SAMPLE_ID=MMETSP0368 /ASSEMBLY_ACC=CAM_ASM_000363 /LENGTH=55 /DNA_ID=CAMNT_0018884059 /DNA_START=13 /DNA_END=177 /DNA_ORIENTATION=+